jgi:hypothetical protein
VPRISNFGGMTIAMYFNDHIPPHFHVVYGDLITRIEIGSGAYMKGNLPLPKPKEKDILDWLNEYRNAIMNAWDDCRVKRTPRKVPPLY